jgi:hypothetical protein
VQRVLESEAAINFILKPFRRFKSGQIQPSALTESAASRQGSRGMNIGIFISVAAVRFGCTLQPSIARRCE